MHGPASRPTHAGRPATGALPDAPSPARSQVLRIHISSEEDPFFLHSLEVSEDDFQGLKVDQGILVDFAHFPDKIISLLERCLASHAADHVSTLPRFQVRGHGMALAPASYLSAARSARPPGGSMQPGTAALARVGGCIQPRRQPRAAPAALQAVLSVKGADSVFKIVETNDFKQLPHITLAFRPGNDSAVKQVRPRLATRCAPAPPQNPPAPPPPRHAGTPPRP